MCSCSIEISQAEMQMNVKCSFLSWWVESSGSCYLSKIARPLEDWRWASKISGKGIQYGKLESKWMSIWFVHQHCFSGFKSKESNVKKLKYYSLLWDETIQLKKKQMHHADTFNKRKQQMYCEGVRKYMLLTSLILLNYNTCWNIL